MKKIRFEWKKKKLRWLKIIIITVLQNPFMSQNPGKKKIPGNS
jgi:hypothetical protein